MASGLLAGLCISAKRMILIGFAANWESISHDRADTVYWREYKKRKLERGFAARGLVGTTRGNETWQGWLRELDERRTTVHSRGLVSKGVEGEGEEGGGKRKSGWSSVPRKINIHVLCVLVLFHAVDVGKVFPHPLKKKRKKKSPSTIGTTISSYYSSNIHAWTISLNAGRLSCRYNLLILITCYYGILLL